MSKFMNRRDFVAIAVVLLLSVAGFLLFNRTGESGSEVVITKDGTVVAQYPLSDNREIDLGGNVVVIDGGSVRMKSADCPDKYCVAQGAISREGETIVCLPHRIVVEVKGGDGIDAVAQ